MITVYISVGNSDDKLTQHKWAAFVGEVRAAIRRRPDRGAIIHGEWFSLADAPWQNACWCVQLPAIEAAPLRSILRGIRAQYGQDSIAWAVAATEFV